MTRSFHARRPRRALLAGLTVGVLTLVHAAPASAAPVEYVRFNFDNNTVPDGTVVTTFVNIGVGTTAQTVLNRNGGTVVNATNLSATHHRAVRFPAHDPATTAKRAVIKVANSGATDQLNPGSLRLEFGADFQLDAVSQSTAAGSIDNGDNLIQRGLYGEPQYKLELDNRRPTCRVQGADGALEVRSLTVVDSTSMWRARCIRDGSILTVHVWKMNADGSTGTYTWRQVTGPTGNVTMASATTPMSIGGKLSSATTVATSTDQFNGLVDNVIYRTGT